MTNPIAAYRAAVERHLADLPDAIREDLAAGLGARLAADPTLIERLGDPEKYARHLRATVELQHESAAARILKGLGRSANRYTTQRQGRRGRSVLEYPHARVKDAARGGFGDGRA